MTARKWSTKLNTPHHICLILWESLVIILPAGLSTDDLQEDYTWWPIEICQKQLDSIHYACFSQPEHSLQTPPGRGVNFIPTSCLNCWLWSQDPLPTVPDNILETLPILKPNKAGEYKSVLFDVSLHIVMTCIGSIHWKHSFQDGLSNVDIVGVTLSRMVHSLGIDIARNMNFVVEDWKWQWKAIVGVQNT